MKLAFVLAGLVVSGCVVGDVADSSDQSSVTRPITPTTHFDNGRPNADHPFFRTLGVNGRSCATCHVAEEGWGVTPVGLQARFDATDGLDPVFRSNDGAVSPLADVSTVEARRAAYAMLLTKGLIRVGIGIPQTAEFELVAVDDPYNYASAAQLSLFRRPLPASNLRFLSEIMWDGREATLLQQSIDATMGHAQATQTSPKEMDKIVKFEESIYTAQVEDPIAGRLDAKDLAGGPKNLSDEAFFLGFNDPFGGNPTGDAFDPNAFTLFDKWQLEVGLPGAAAERRAAIYRGQQLVNTRTFAITGVRGLNDALGVPSFQGTCTTCHDTPNVGSHSLARAFDLGLSDASRRAATMPLYTLRNKTTNVTIQTTDPGRALITGKWDDIGKFKTPALRGVSLRAPFFHNGNSATLRGVIGFYNARFAMGLTDAERADMVAFLESL